MAVPEKDQFQPESEITFSENPFITPDLQELYEYLASIQQYPLLTAKQKKVLWQSESIKEVKEHLAFTSEVPPENQVSIQTILQDSSSIKELAILSHLRLVIPIAQQHAWLDVPLMDRIQAGNLGLMRAAEDFDKRRGYVFSTYAQYCIDTDIKKEYSGKNNIIQIPYNTFFAYLKAKNLVSYPLIYHSEEELRTLLVDGKIPAKEIQNVITLLKNSATDSIFLGQPTSMDEDTTYEETVSYTGPSPENLALQKISWEEKIAPLKDYQKQILTYRYVFGLSTPEIGKLFGKTGEAIRQELVKISNILTKDPDIVEEQKVTTEINATIRQISQEEYREKNIIYLSKHGVPDAEIAAIFSMDPKAIKTILKK